MNFNLLKEKISKNNMTIGVVGLGYVGLPLSLKFVNKKINVIGFDINKKVISILNKKKFHIQSIPKKFRNKNFFKNFLATNDFRNISRVDVIIICVPTPITINKKPDLKYIKSTISLINPYLKQDQILILESTTYPGTTRELIAKKISKKFDIGKNYYLGYSPERENPGENSILSNNIIKICSGYTKNCLELVGIIYKKILPIKKVSSLEVAEMTKLHENIFRTVNISYVNEMKMICDALNINIQEVIIAAKTKPFGFKAFYPGPGIGGHCIPVDPFYLTWICDKKNIKTQFIKLSANINDKLAYWIVKKIRKKLKKNKKIKGLAIGLSYKKNIEDTRESPSFNIINEMLKINYKIDYHDPFHKKFPKQKKFNFKLKYVDINKRNLEKYDFIIILTDHTNVNYKILSKYSKIIFDTRGCLKKSKKVINV